MNPTRRNMGSLQWTGGALLFSLQVIICCITLVLPGAAATPHQKGPVVPFGIAWSVTGNWQADGRSGTLANGDPIAPGALLHVQDTGGSHAILIFLPDGQRIFYECYQSTDCARDFRVPALYRTPEPFALDLLARIGAALLRANQSPITEKDRDARLPEDEILSVLHPGGQVQVGGLASALPDGRYTSIVRRIDPQHRQQFPLAFAKSGSSITLTLPSAGLYDLTIYDQLNSPRIDLLVAAVPPAKEAALQKSFAKATILIEDWNEDYPGWPIHDFRRACLESLVLGIPPQPSAQFSVATARSHHSDVTAEPVFSPNPGVFRDVAKVTLQSSTPGAVIHFTVDGSQPFGTSPVYRAPIIVMGTELNIKAFATAPGKKDSPVVTGIFRIGDESESSKGVSRSSTPQGSFPPNKAAHRQPRKDAGSLVSH